MIISRNRKISLENSTFDVTNAANLMDKNDLLTIKENEVAAEETSSSILVEEFDGDEIYPDIKVQSKINRISSMVRSYLKSKSPEDLFFEGHTDSVDAKIIRRTEGFIQLILSFDISNVNETKARDNFKSLYQYITDKNIYKCKEVDSEEIIKDIFDHFPNLVYHCGLPVFGGDLLMEIPRVIHEINKLSEVSQITQDLPTFKPVDTSTVVVEATKNKVFDSKIDVIEQDTTNELKDKTKKSMKLLNSINMSFGYVKLAGFSVGLISLSGFAYYTFAKTGTYTPIENIVSNLILSDTTNTQLVLKEKMKFVQGLTGGFGISLLLKLFFKVIR